MSDEAPSPALPEFTASTPEIGAYLDSASGEVVFLKAVMRARPVGVHRHFHALSIRERIRNESNIILPIDDIWAKLSSCYDLWKLEEREGVDWPTEDDDPDAVPPLPKDFPTPDQNLRVHKHFKAEFSLPEDDFYSLMVARATAGPDEQSPPVSPSAFSVADTITSDKGRTPGRGRGRGKSSRGTTRGRGRGRGSGTKGGRPRTSNAKKDDPTNEDEESSELTEAEDVSEEESAQGSARPSETPMDEDGESEQEGEEDEEEGEDAPRTRGTRGKKRGGPRGRGTSGQTPLKKRRKSNAK